MNILFMSLSDYSTINFYGLYSDLLRQFILHNNEVYLISPVERRNFKQEMIINERGSTIVKIKILNIQKTNIIEKGMSMVTIEKIIIKAINRYFSKIKFDLILYPTPPITLLKAVRYVKERDGAKTYLLLKDIFPQNAIDLGMMKKRGLMGVIYKYFRRQEKNLYEISDHIGCMSQANMDYIIEHNPELDSSKIEVCPNSYELRDMSCSAKDKEKIRKKYGIPLSKRVFVYGGNLGKPQGVPFIIECLKKQKNDENSYFLIVGSGTEYHKIRKFVEDEKPNNIKLMQRLPKEDYDRMIGSCDVGLIFLDHRFTIPNFPCRLIGYMQAKLPVLACTDANTDIGKTIVDGKFGWWCESNDSCAFSKMIKKICQEDLSEKIKNSGERMADYSSEKTYEIIRKSIS